MSYEEQVVELASQIGDEASKLKSLEKARNRWTQPKGETFYIGGTNYWVVREDGTVTPGLEAIQREAIKLHDDQIFAAKSRIEGLRWKLVQLGKTGGAA